MRIMFLCFYSLAANACPHFETWANEINAIESRIHCVLCSRRQFQHEHNVIIQFDCCFFFYLWDCYDKHIFFCVWLLRKTKIHSILNRRFLRIEWICRLDFFCGGILIVVATNRWSIYKYVTNPIIIYGQRWNTETWIKPKKSGRKEEMKNLTHEKVKRNRLADLLVFFVIKLFIDFLHENGIWSNDTDSDCKWN